jgi:5-methylcytosine-specific restriction endonuclease McrA
MFIPNQYTTRYYEIIENANRRAPGTLTRRQAKHIVGYIERHHIVPKSLGGSDELNNLVWLTANEHLEVHLLLVKMVDEQQLLRKMYAAVIRMCNPQSRTQQRVFTEDYNDIRKECARLHSEYMKGKNLGSKNPFFNKKHSEESKKLISLGGRGLKRSVQTKKNISDSKLGSKNPATKEVTCPHCGKTGKAGGMLKHHFDHCKIK